MRSFLLLTLLIPISCGHKSTPLIYGKTSSAELLMEKGEPLKKEPIPAVNGEMFIYPENEKYQIEKDMVVAGYKNPVEDEATVLFWKHKFKDCQTALTPLKVIDPGHTPPEMEYSCDSMGLKVIYIEGADLISRVIQYAQK